MFGTLKVGAYQVGPAGAIAAQGRQVDEVGPTGAAVCIHLYPDVAAGLRHLDEVGDLATADEIAVEQCRQIEAVTLAEAVVEYRVQVERVRFGKGEAVGACTAGERIAASATDQQIVAVAAAQNVVAATADQQVVVVLPGQRVVARIAKQQVPAAGPAAAVYGLVAGGAGDHIVAAAVAGVKAAAGEDAVGTGQCITEIALSGGEGNIVDRIA
ncbi:hypothetical protein D3C78_1190700 [compost metagenome]